jgi:hypothetical protein
MRIATYSASALLLGLLLSACGGSDEENTPQNTPNVVLVLPDSTGEPSGASAQIFDPSGIAFEQLDLVHTFGGTACPQPLGTIVVTNDATTPLSTTLEVLDPGVAVELSSGSLDVPAGGSGTYTIVFTCMSTDDIDTMLALTITLDGRSGEFQIPLKLDVQGAP